MGGLYGAPRILQCIAQDKVIPALAFLANGVSGSLCWLSLFSLFFRLHLSVSPKHKLLAGVSGLWGETEWGVEVVPFSPIPGCVRLAA